MITFLFYLWINKKNTNFTYKSDLFFKNSTFSHWLCLSIQITGVNECQSASTQIFRLCILFYQRPKAEGLSKKWVAIFLCQKGSNCVSVWYVCMRRRRRRRRCHKTWLEHNTEQNLNIIQNRTSIRCMKYDYFFILFMN